MILLDSTHPVRLVILGAFSVQDYVSKLTMSDSTNLFEVVFYLVNECLSIFLRNKSLSNVTTG